MSAGVTSGVRREVVDGRARCASCEEWRPVESFAVWRGKRHSYCLDCKRSHARDWARNRKARQRLREFLTGGAP